MPDMNIEQAIENLATNLDKFPQLPFVTDLEVREVFGQEVARALEFLEGTNKESGICSACGGKCCQQMGCEFFYQAFGGCPIHEYRPLLCRFHYCEKFGEDQKSLIRELSDIFVSGVSRLEAESGAIPSIELNMLLYSACRKPEESYPRLIKDIRHIVAAAKRGEVDREKAIMMLREEVLSYRSTNITGRSKTPARH
jgi:hypothetical protein